MKLTYTSSIILFALFISCATYKPNYAKKNFVNPKLPETTPTHSFFLIGDAGNVKMNEELTPLNFFQEELNKASENSTALFLGDNVYPTGIYPKKHKNYQLSKYRLKVQTDAAQNYKGRPIFIPGNHDWYNGIDGLKRQEKLVEKALGKNTFLPEGGCGLEDVKINDKLTLIIIDSEWFIMNWNGAPKMNDNCTIKTRERFIEELSSLFKKNRDKNVVVAMHHPLYSNGPHGGSFSVKDHMSPVPVLGTLKNMIRAHSGIQTDNFNKKYSELILQIETIAEDFNDRIVFVSGHEHNLQYITQNGFKQIVSGAGSKQSAALIGYGAQFTYGNHGYSKLNFYENGTAFVEFYAANDKDGHKLLFRKKIMNPFSEKKEFSFTEYREHKKEITTSIYPKEATKVSGFHKFMWGSLNREKYGKEITVPILELDTIFGGLTPIRKGGGNQTNSLRLENPEGKQYVLRSMYKDGSRIMGGILKGTFLVDVVQDIFTMSHPYAAFVIPDMAEAVNIYHTNPKLYYMPKQPKLGDYNTLFGDGLYLLEERPAGNREDVSSFGNSKKIISTYDVLAKIRKNEKHFIDQRWAIRSRLFDMVIGDWDRHEDQWRWASFKTEEGKTYYRPIPRDRDQPFSKFDGIMIPVIKQFVPLVRNMQSLDRDIKNINWYNNYARFFDAEFLNELNHEEWIQEASYIQQHLTDDIIEKSIKKLPKNIYDIDGEEIISKIKARRDQLKKFATAYYKKQSRIVQIIGSDKKDRFEIERLNNEETKVTVFRKKKGGDIKTYQRTFRIKETKEIHLYGLNEDDEFSITGNVDKGILLRLIGGQNHDIYEDSSSVSGWSKKTKIYDFINAKNTVKESSETQDLRSDNYYRNTYNHRDINNNTAIVYPNLGSNPDDGFFFGASVTYTQQGFKKRPFSSSHIFAANFYSSTSGFDVEYTGRFTEFIGDWHLELNAKATSANYAFNFFGWGNESPFDQNLNLDFYRVKKEEFSFSPALFKQLRGGSSVTFKGIVEGIKIGDSPTRNITNFNNNPTNIFQRNYFVGGEFNFTHLRVDNTSFPTKGMHFNFTTGAKVNTNITNRYFGYLKTSLAIYQNLVSNRSLVFASQIGTDINFKNRFEIYHAVALGGRTTLRSFNNNRFTGTESFYHTNDLRLKLGDLTSFVPLKYGLTAGFDYGKVWSPSARESNLWHNSYGGSLWINGMDLFTTNIALFNGREGSRFTFSIGFNF